MRYILIAITSVLLCTLVSGPSAHEIKLPQNIDELSLSKISQGIYVVHGMQALPDKNNNGFMSNTGVIVSEKGVVIIDTGGSLQVGKLIVKKIRELTDQPIVAVFNTHVHGDHWLGNAAIQAEFPNARIYAHKRAIERLKKGEAEHWRDIFMSMTNKSVSGNTLVLPDHSLKGGETLNIAGTTLKIHHTGHAHTDNDVMIEVTQEQLLFAGDIIEYGRLVSSDVPQDFDILGQIKAINYALQLPVDIFVPGHGVTGGREIPEAALQFLEILYSSVKRYYESGLQDFEMRDYVAKDLAKFSNWYGYDQIGRLISFVYQQVEKKDFQ